MTSLTPWIFQFRWIYWIAGAILTVLPLLSHWRPREQSAQKNFGLFLFLICAAFFALSFWGKITQYESLSLNGQDFWLFTDLLEQMKSGGFFITRFAPQSIGYVQHGAVHPMYSWAFLLPFVWGIGSVLTALVFQPLVLSAAGAMLGLLSRPRLGAFPALCFSVAFLVSTQVGKILTYEIHPEVAYPFFVLLWLWSLGLDQGTSKDRPSTPPNVRWFALLISTVICVGIKEDSFLVLGPWILWAILTLKGQQRKGAFLCLGLAGFGFLFQMILVKNWTAGTWGPSTWNGVPVLIRAGVGQFNGVHWSGLGEALSILKGLVHQQGGLLSSLRSHFSFYVSRPWLSLIILAPWVVLSFRFWMVTVPLATVYCLIGSPRLLWNYYSAPFLGSFWFCAIAALAERKSLSLGSTPERATWRMTLWALGASLILGSGGIQIFFPNAEVKQVKRETQALVPCLGQRGLVPAHLIPFVPFEKIYTERFPRTDEEWKWIDFVLVSPNIGRYELPAEEARKLFQRLSQDRSSWEPVGEQCQTVSPTGNERVVLFRRRVRI